jgi:hypothetical protein
MSIADRILTTIGCLFAAAFFVGLLFDVWTTLILAGQCVAIGLATLFIGLAIAAAIGKLD